jgi:hypothetical protein
MNQIIFTTLLSTTALLITLASASAQEAVTVVNTIGQPVPTTVQNYQQITSPIVTAITNASGQDTSNITSLSKLMSNSNDVIDMANVKNAVSQARYHALQAATSGPGDCNALQAGASFSQFSAQVAAWREQEADLNLNWLDNEPTVSGVKNPSAVSQSLAYQKLSQATCANGFQTAAEAANGLCGSKTTTAGANPGLDTYAPNLFLNDDLTTVQATAAQLFQSNAITPTPLPPITPAEMTSPEGPEILEIRKAVVARISLAGLFMSGALARRQPWTEAPPGVADWAAGEAGQLGGAIPQTNGSYFPNGVSMMDYMEVRADSYVFDTNFLAGVSAQTDDAPLLKTLIQIEAYRTWLQFQQYKLDEERGMMEAAQLANSQQPTTVGH